MAKRTQSRSLWLVTSGAVPATIEPKSHNQQVAQSPLWGMGKVIALEHPELNCVRVDLDPHNLQAAALILFEEIWSKSTEDQVAFRDEVRLVPR